MSDHSQARIAALLPPIRSHLLAGVLVFTQAACRVPGVTRIALIGSLATNKSDPKDADMLTICRLSCGHTSPRLEQCRRMSRRCCWRHCEN